MQKLDFNLRQGRAKLKVENADDLWYLTTIVDKGDVVKGKTFRKIQKGSEEKSDSVKQAVFLAVQAEKVEFSRNSGTLRIGGKVIEGPEDIPRGAWHSFSVEPGTVLTVEKGKWLSYQIEKLNEACSSKIPPILICVFDREDAYFALMKKYGYEVLSHIEGKVQKKDVDEKVKGTFYDEIIKNLEEYSKRHNAEKIIVGSPAFWKEELVKEMKNPELRKKVIFATCSSAGKNAIDEVLKRPETAEALREQRAAKEIAVVEKLLDLISKDGAAAYGMKESKEAAEAGAVEILAVTDTLIQKMRDDGTYAKLDYVMRAVDSAKGKIAVISSEHEGGKKLDGLGGIGCLLRYKMKY